MELKQKILENYKEAMKQKDVVKKDILNYTIAQIKNKEIDLQKSAWDDDVIQIIKKEIKTRNESISFLQKAGNIEEIDLETKKIHILESYLPEMLDANATKQLILDYMKTLWIKDLKAERWRLIWIIMSKHRSAIDWWVLNDVINNIINS